jgi:dTDP-D-glucose 4,6-dehydratase
MAFSTRMCYVIDIRKATRDLGWQPRVDKEAGIRRLLEWVSANRSMFEAIQADAFAGALNGAAL